MNEENSELRTQLSTILAELSSLKQEVQGTNQNVATEVKKLKTEKDLQWKFQGNKSQYDFNCEVSDIVKQTLWAIENNKLDHAVEQLKEAQDRLHTRNKHIRIADTSAGGWETVRQYELNPIASDSDDESKIYKAESRALKKRKSSRGRSTNSTSFSGASTSSSNSAFGAGSSQSVGRGRFFRGQNNNAGGNSNVGHFGPAPGPCYACGEFSHFRRNCPYIRSSGTAPDQTAAQHGNK